MDKQPPKKDGGNTDSVGNDKPLSAGHPGELDENPTPNDNKADAQDKRGSAWTPPKITAYGTIAIVIITAVYTCYAREQVIQMEGAVVAATNQAYQMEKAVSVATEQTKQIRDQFRLDQRAWIGLTRIEFICERDRPMILKVIFQNVGKTPAKSVTHHTKTRTRSVGTLPSFAFEDLTEESSRGIVAPQQYFHSVQDSSESLSETDRDAVIDDILAGRQRVWVYGVVKFDDIFDSHHWYKYCYLYDPNTKSFGAYAEHNETDNN